MLVSSWVLPALCETEINQVQSLSILLHADQYVLGLKIPMDISHLMEQLYPRDQLISDDQHCLQTQLSTAIHEQVLKGGPEELNRHDVVVALLAEPHELGEPDLAHEVLQQFGLLDKLGTTHLFGFLFKHKTPLAYKLYSDLLIGLQVHCEEYLTERSAADLLAHLEAARHADLVLGIV